MLTKQIHWLRQRMILPTAMLLLQKCPFDWVLEGVGWHVCSKINLLFLLFFAETLSRKFESEAVVFWWTVARLPPQMFCPYSRRRRQWNWTGGVPAFGLWGRLRCGCRHQPRVSRWDVQQSPGQPQRSGPHGDCGGRVVKRQREEAGDQHTGVRNSWTSAHLLVLSSSNLLVFLSRPVTSSLPQYVWTQQASLRTNSCSTWRRNSLTESFRSTWR